MIITLYIIITLTAIALPKLSIGVIEYFCDSAVYSDAIQGRRI